METIHQTTRSCLVVPFGVVSWMVLAYSAAHETPFLDTYRCFPYDHTSTRSGIALIFEKGTYVNGRRLPLQGRGWGFESLRAHHQNAEVRAQRSEVGFVRRD